MKTMRTPGRDAAGLKSMERPDRPARRLAGRYLALAALLAGFAGTFVPLQDSALAETVRGRCMKQIITNPKNSISVRDVVKQKPRETRFRSCVRQFARSDLTRDNNARIIEIGKVYKEKLIEVIDKKYDIIGKNRKKIEKTYNKRIDTERKTFLTMRNKLEKKRVLAMNNGDSENSSKIYNKIREQDKLWSERYRDLVQERTRSWTH